MSLSKPSVSLALLYCFLISIIATGVLSNSATSQLPSESIAAKNQTSRFSEGRIIVRNNCDFAVWAGHRDYMWNTGGFLLQKNEEQSFMLTNGRVWGQTGCSGGQGCDTPDSFISLAEMNFQDDGTCWYNLSNVDGYNLPMSIVPVNAGVGGRCESIGCRFDLNRCPDDLNLKTYNSRGELVACKSACRATDDYGYCCLGGESSCNIHEYSRRVKSDCPLTYTYAFDNKEVYNCRPGNDGLRVTFC